MSTLLAVQVAPTALPPEPGLTLHQVVTSFPHDPLSLAVFAFVLFSMGMVIYYGRDRTGRSGPRKSA